MSDADEGVALADDPGEREYGPVALVLACVAAVVLAAALVPFVAGTDSGSPAESLVPVPQEAEGSAGGAGAAGGGGASGFGALNVGDQQSVGGQIGSSDGNPYRAQDTEVHFEVRSEEPSYWRTGSFDSYTGDGWSSSGPSDTRAPIDGSAVRYRVELAQSAGSPPTVWRPTDLDDAEGVELTDGGVARADGALDAGSEYVGVSRKPPRDPSVLAASGRDYPDEVEQRYTDLPAETDDALGSFTDEVTAGADTPYETATSVESWLESNKDYSLNVSEPRGDDVAEQFVLEMDAGYCEYFATSMVAMLRTQDVPARYVVGYSTGQSTGPNTYQVRAMNAHAWVEVYFADVGWVRFDPTPGSERLQQEQESFEESDAEGSYEPTEEGSPNETLSSDPDNTTTPGEPGGTPTPGGPDVTPGGPGSTPEGPDQPTPTGPTPVEPSTPTPTPDNPFGGIAEAYNITLNRSAVPGATVEISVVVGAQPVVGAEVSVNGEQVGVTGRDGTVVTTVPYADEFVVTVSGGRTADASVSDVDPPIVAGVGAPTLSGVDPPDASGPGPPSGDAGTTAEDGVGASTDAVAQDNETKSFDVETNATVSVAGDVRTGETVVVTATVGDLPLPDAAVTVDGERVATTDPDGRARVTLPDMAGNATLRVERGPVAGERTLELGALAVAVDPSWPVPVAGTAVDVTATVGDEPAAGVPVRVGGERVGETGVNGTLTASLPFESTVPVAVTAAGQTARTTVSDPLVNLAGVVVGLLGTLLVGVVVVRRKRGPGTLPEGVVGVLAAIPRTLVRGLVGVSRVVPRAIRAAIERARLTLASLAALVRGEAAPGELLAALRAWLASRAAMVRRALAGVSPRGERSSANHTAVADDEEGGPRTTIRQAWRRFLEYVSVERPKTKTPGQIATHAASRDDLPADAVATLRDEFRAVEYGPRSPDDAVPAVAEAIDAIEGAVSTDDDGDGVGDTGQARPGGGGDVERSGEGSD